MGRLIHRLGRAPVPTPDGDLEQLLAAALLPPDRALEAFDAWRREHDLDDVDDASQRLLPLVAQHLGPRLDGTDAGRIRGISRYWWARVTALRHRTGPVVGALADALGSPPLVLKGAALASYYERRSWLRAMQDVDLLVRPEQFDAAWGVLVSEGFEPVRPTDRHDPRVADEPSLGFVGPRQVQVDIHRRALSVALHPEAEADLWAAAEDGEVGGAAVRVPHRADLLLQVIEHACRWNPVDRASRWVVDVAVLLDGWNDHATDRLVALAHRHDLAAVATPALGYVADRFGLDAARRLAAAVGPGSTGSAVEWQARIRSPADRNPLQRAVVAVADEGRRRAPTATGRHLTLAAAAAGVRHPVALPFEAMFVAAGRPAWARPVRRRWRFPHRSALALEGSLVGREVAVAAGGLVNALLGPGWAAPERHGTWSIAEEAVLRLPVGDEGAGLRLSLTLSTLPGRRIEVDVVVGHRRIGRATLDGDQPTALVVEVPSGSTTGGVLEAVLVVPSTAAPAGLGLSADPRRLGVFLWELGVAPVGDAAQAEVSPPRRRSRIRFRATA